MAFSRSNPPWYAAGLVLLVYALLNLPVLWGWLLASALVGFMPIRHPRWWKYGLLALTALTVGMLWNGISMNTLATVGAITRLSGPGYLAAVLVVDALTMLLVATTVQWWVGRWLLAKHYGFKKRD